MSGTICIGVQSVSEQNGDGNRIAVSSVRSQSAAAVDHRAHGKVKLSGHGQPTVIHYAKPNYGAAIAGMGSKPS